MIKGDDGACIRLLSIFRLTPNEAMATLIVIE